MTYDGLVLAAVAAELTRSIKGGAVQHVRQHNETDFTLEIRNAGRSHLIFMSVDARFARVHATASTLAVPKSAPNFCMLLRKYLKGSFITSVEQSGFDRVLHIRTEAPDGDRNKLILEMMGKHSNLILISDSGRILGAAKNVTAAISRYRQILPGREYMPPPGSKLNPIEITRDEFDSIWNEGHAQDDPKRWLVAAFSGIGPFLADEIMLRAGESTPDAIWSALCDIREIVSNKDYAPVLITDEKGSSIYTYPIPVGQYPIPNQHERHLINETLDTLYRDLVRRDRFDSEYKNLDTNIRRAVAWRAQMLRDLEKAISEGEHAIRYKQYGDLIIAAAANIQKGQKIAKVVDYYDPEMPEVEIPLDEKQSPMQNAERYFRRYRKVLDGAKAAVDRKIELIDDMEILESAKDRLQAESSVESLKALRDFLTKRGLLRAELQPILSGRKDEPEFGSAKIRRVTSSDGYEILYGENSQSNDYLTTKVARPNDFWFHARSVTGSHVIIRTANRPDAVPMRTIREAAEIAARNSNAKHSSLVAVDYTLRKHVRKPKSTAPGRVLYGREKTIDVTPQTR